MGKSDILLVEDNPDDAELTLHAFRKHDMVDDIILVRDGEEALDYIFGRGAYSERDTERNPSLILLDLKLPKIDGLEVLKQIRSDDRMRRIPVVILTTSDDEQDIMAGYNLGTNSFIRKPVDFDAFVSTVQQLGLYWLVTNTGAPH